MKIEELIEELSQYNPDTEVAIYDTDCEAPCKLSGVSHGLNIDHPKVYTDWVYLMLVDEEF